MKKAFTISALALALAACSQTSNNNTQASATNALAPLDKLAVSPNDQRGYRTLKLENNIEVILVSDPTTEKSAAALNVGVGLLQDPMTQQGMAHYLEHLLFLGTDKYPETNQYKEFLTENGGVSNASTWLTYTNYMFKVNNDAYDEALDRFSDFFKSPKLYPEYTEKEINAVNAEWSMRREMDFFGQFKLSRDMMGEHPANRFLIGNLETLGDKENSNLHKETVEFYNKYYSANIMKVALISNASLDEMEKLAKKHFSPIKDKGIEKPQVKQEINFAELGGKKIYYKPNQDLKQLKLDFTIKNNQDQFKFKPNAFVSYLLGSEMPGTPAQQLKALGWISSLNAGGTPNHYGNYGEMSITLNLTDLGMQNRDEIVAIIMQYIDLVKEKGVDEKYYKEIKTSLDNEFRFLQKVDEFSYAAQLVNSMQDYPLNYSINAPYYFGQFNAKAVDDVLSQLTPDTLRIWYTSKNEKVDQKQHFYAGEYRIEDIAEREIATWKKPTQVALALPKVNRLLPENFDLKTAGMKQSTAELKVEKDGVKVWHYPSQLFAEQPKGILKIDLNAGEANADIETQVSLALWSDLYNLQQSLLQAEASVAGISTRATTSNGMSLLLNGFTDKQNLLLAEMLSDLIPEVTETNFAQAKDRLIRGINNAQKQFTVRQLFPALQNLTEANNFEDDALIAAAQKLDVATFKARLEKLVKANQPRVFAFGNYNQGDLENVAEVISKTLGSNHTQTSFAKTKTIAPLPQQVLSYQKDTAAADNGLLDIHVHRKAGFKQKAIANVLAKHFSHEAFNQLRTEEQLAYAVGAFYYPVDDYASIGLYIQSPVMDLVQAQKRFDDFKVEYKAKLDALTPEQFAAIKQGVLVGLTQAPKNMYEEVSPIFSDWYKENWNYDSKQQMITEVHNVKLADIKQFYNETLANPKASRINVQLRGANYQDKPFAEIKGQTKITDIAELTGKVSYQL
ncbi:insulinase family protein [Pseudoalteromonas sp. SS15]|uniref:insulinase family protein n=1 Tax=Pseudoalteromonas sp. SS15 TaxID=3139393 RepID=UPI003BA96E49